MILLVWLFLIVVGPLPGTEFAIDKKFLFVNVPNGKISLQPEMQNHGSLKMFIINVIQFISFNMIQKLTNVNLSML